MIYYIYNLCSCSLSSAYLGEQYKLPLHNASSSLAPDKKYCCFTTLRIHAVLLSKIGNEQIINYKVFEVITWEHYLFIIRGLGLELLQISIRIIGNFLGFTVTHNLGTIRCFQILLYTNTMPNI